MKYEVRLSLIAQKTFDRLQDDVAERIGEKLKMVADDPFRYLQHFEGQGYKLRIGDYRLLIDVDSTERILFVRVLDKRGRIYK